MPQGEAGGQVGQRSIPKEGVTRPPEVIELVPQVRVHESTPLPAKNSWFSWLHADMMGQYDNATCIH